MSQREVQLKLGLEVPLKVAHTIHHNTLTKGLQFELPFMRVLVEQVSKQHTKRQTLTRLNNQDQPLQYRLPCNVCTRNFQWDLPVKKMANFILNEGTHQPQQHNTAALTPPQEHNTRSNITRTHLRIR